MEPEPSIDAPKEPARFLQGYESGEERPLSSPRWPIAWSQSIPFGPLLGLIGVLLIFMILIGFTGGVQELTTFLRPANLQVMVHENTIPAIIALGSLVVMISGGIDLSVGSVVALVTVVTMLVYRNVYAQSGSTTVASAVAIPAGIVAGGLCGAANGLMITRLRVAPFVGTLGMFSMARGLAIWLAKRQMITFPSGSRPGWTDLFVSTEGPRYLFFYPGFFFLVILAAATAVLLHFTVLGRYCYAIGSNEATARLCGVPIDRSKLVIYTLAGLLTGVAGVLAFAHVGAGDPESSIGLELIVIAGVVIGGASLNGGQGTVIGTMLGMLILAVLDNGVNVFRVPVEVKWILIGAIIVLNTALSGWQQRKL